ncbi:MAG TPA: VOC family protein [bacterium]|nr:VOC family protein [bacterium]
MTYTKLVPFIATDKVEQSKAFYTTHLGFRVTFDCGWYITVQSPDDGVELAFMDPREKSQPMFAGHGLNYALQVDDVDALYAALDKNTVTVTQELRDNPWGDRSFAVLDPNGIRLYFYQNIEPADEYKDAFVG